MKPFDLELAKKGHPVCTRSGLGARIICFDRENSGKYPIVFLHKHCGSADESVYYATITGKSALLCDSPQDLFMKPVKKTGWVNFYKVSSRIDTGQNTYKSEKEARSRAGIGLGDYLGAFEVSWEE